MRFARLIDWLAWLETCHPQAIDLELTRIATVARRMNLLRDGSPSPIARKIVTVAGTNGKGSCVATLETIFRAQGQAVGAYTSPHLVRYNERIRINGCEVGDDDLMAAFSRVDDARGDVSLTYFEFGTLAAFDLFARASLDIAILEVGLGGRLDAVNLIAPDIAVITNIDLDHTEWLGNSRESIAREKAGILRPHIPCVCGDADPPSTLLQAISFNQARCYAVDDAFRFGVDANGFWIDISDADGARVMHRGLPEPALPLPSVAMGLQAAVLLGDSSWLRDREFLESVLSTLQLAGRCQRFQFDGVEVIVDVAHNAAGVRHLSEQLQRHPASGKTLAVFTMLSDKDLDSAIAALKPAITAWFVADLPGVARARAARDVADALFRQGIHMISVSKNLRQAYARACMLAQPGDRVVVFGSFYVAGELLPRIMKQLMKELVDDDDEA